MREWARQKLVTTKEGREQWEQTQQWLDTPPAVVTARRIAQTTTPADEARSFSAFAAMAGGG